ncbi:hypothetical protein R1sor_008348 [Riccia sorocarpa]|uniref:RING-type domain-containing protein n=1 Tax=Riccia sorocarpa TaxID=122646 RepID=A0ABD3HT54_9MARC
MTSSFLPSGVRDSRMQTVNTRSTQHSMATRFKLRRIDVGNLKRKLKQLFTLNFKAFKSCSRSGATLTPMMIDEEDNKENRPTEHKLPFQLRIFELCSPGPETEDDDCGLPMEVFERLCELEEEMIWLRTRVQHRGEEFRFIDAESLKHIMKTTITEYEAQFWKTVKESVKSQIRCVPRPRAAEADLAHVQRKRRDSPIPCMHFLYCSESLHGHQRSNRRCPTCQAPISVLLNLNLKM